MPSIAFYSYEITMGALAGISTLLSRALASRIAVLLVLVTLSLINLVVVPYNYNLIVEAVVSDMEIGMDTDIDTTTSTSTATSTSTTAIEGGLDAELALEYTLMLRAQTMRRDIDTNKYDLEVKLEIFPRLVEAYEAWKVRSLQRKKRGARSSSASTSTGGGSSK